MAYSVPWVRAGFGVACAEAGPQGGMPQARASSPKTYKSPNRRVVCAPRRQTAFGGLNLHQPAPNSFCTFEDCKSGIAMRMESPDDYTRWIERAARRLEEAMRNDDVKQAEAEMKLIEATLKVLRQKFAEHIANMK